MDFVDISIKALNQWHWVNQKATYHGSVFKRKRKFLKEEIWMEKNAFTCLGETNRHLGTVYGDDHMEKIWKEVLKEVRAISGWELANKQG